MVIDGVPVESDLFDVSPENIESINVLKGTAAAALYGSRGKDGAILITTKLAKEDGLTVTAGLSSMVSAGFTVFPETQTEFGSGSNGMVSARQNEVPRSCLHPRYHHLLHPKRHTDH